MFRPPVIGLGAALLLLMLGGCSGEARSIYATQPQTPPNGPDDPRVTHYQDNVYQVSQGSRYFTWYGCGGCHGNEAQGVLVLGDGVWKHGGAFDQVYAFIDHGHPGKLARYGERIPTEQMWEITAYVRDLPQEKPEKNRRQDLDAEAEPQGRTWSGPLR